MNLGLEEKVFLVTGATSGIGLATATLLLDEGGVVMMSARTVDASAEAWHNLRRIFGKRCAYVAADLEDIYGPAHAVEATVRVFGRIDGAIVNGVPTAMGGLSETSDLDLLTFLEGKAVACARLARAAVPTMRSQGGGVLIFVAGISAHSGSGQAYLSGTMATTAIHGLTKTLADEVSGDGIRVLTVDPGLTDTRRFRQQSLPRLVIEQGRDEESILDELRRAIPLGRMAEASDIADAIVFLASRRARHITGTCLLVDGGASRSVR